MRWEFLDRGQDRNGQSNRSRWGFFQSPKPCKAFGLVSTAPGLEANTEHSIIHMAQPKSLQEDWLHRLGPVSFEHQVLPKLSEAVHVNYRVKNLDKVLAKLRRERVKTVRKVEDSKYGQVRLGSRS